MKRFDLREFIDFAYKNADIKREENKINTDLIKIHIFMSHLIQHGLTPEIKTELKEYIKSWSLMLEE